MTGLRIMFRGSSMTNDREGRPSGPCPGRTACRFRACRRWILKVWASEAAPLRLRYRIFGIKAHRVDSSDPGFRFRARAIWQGGTALG